MRCPTCGHNQRFRSGMVCGECRYHFVLSPKQPPHCADRAFMRVIDAASQDGTREYTPLQLHATLFRRRNRGWWHRIFVASGSGDVDATLRAIGTWRRSQRDLGPILDAPRLESNQSEPEWSEPDIFSYGAEGVLLVDRPLLVDLLVARRVHMSAKVAIVSGLETYPSALANPVRSMLASRPDLPVFLLHSSRSDAPTRLEAAARQVFGVAQNPVIDLGLPVDVASQIPVMRWTRRIREVPVEFLPNRWITAGVATAIERRVSLVELIQRPDADATDGRDVYIPWGAGSSRDQDHDGGDDLDGDGDFG